MNWFPIISISSSIPKIWVITCRDAEVWKFHRAQQPQIADTNPLELNLKSIDKFPFRVVQSQILKGQLDSLFCKERLVNEHNT